MSDKERAREESGEGEESGKGVVIMIHDDVECWWICFVMMKPKFWKNTFFKSQNKFLEINKIFF